MTPCDNAWHDLVKASPALWSKQHLIGFQPAEDGALELRNCRVCGSTLAKERPDARRDAPRTFPAASKDAA